MAKRFPETTGWGLMIKGSDINVAGIQKHVPLSGNENMLESADRELPQEFQKEFYDMTGCRVQ